MSAIVTAGQVWRPTAPDLVDRVVWVVADLYNDPYDGPIYARIVRVTIAGDGDDFGRFAIECDQLREQAELVYDATLIDPTAVS